MSNYEIQGDIVIKGVAGTNGNIVTHDADGKLLDSGVNISEIASISGGFAQLDARYVNVDGDTMTGTLRFNAQSETEKFINAYDTDGMTPRFSVGIINGSAEMTLKDNGDGTFLQATESVLRYGGYDVLTTYNNNYNVGFGEITSNSIGGVGTNGNIVTHDADGKLLDSGINISSIGISGGGGNWYGPGTFPEVPQYTTQTASISADPLVDISATIAIQDSLFLSGLTGQLVGEENRNNQIYSNAPAGLNIVSKNNIGFVAGQNNLGNISENSTINLTVVDISGNCGLAMYGKGPNNPNGSRIFITSDSVDFNGFAGVDSPTFIRLTRQPNIDQYVEKTTNLDTTTTMWIDVATGELKIGDDVILTTNTLFVSPPSTSNTTGKQGQFSYDTDYFYVCVATNTWKRVALSSW